MLYDPPEDLTPLAPTLFERGTFVPDGRPLAEATGTFMLCYLIRTNAWVDAYYGASVQLPAHWRRATLRWGMN